MDQGFELQGNNLASETFFTEHIVYHKTYQLSHTLPPQLFYLNKTLLNPYFTMNTVKICNPHHENLNTSAYMP